MSTASDTVVFVHPPAKTTYPSEVTADESSARATLKSVEVHEPVVESYISTRLDTVQTLGAETHSSPPANRALLLTAAPIPRARRRIKLSIRRVPVATLSMSTVVQFPSAFAPPAIITSFPTLAAITKRLSTDSPTSPKSIVR